MEIKACRLDILAITEIFISPFTSRYTYIHIYLHKLNMIINMHLSLIRLKIK